MDKKLATVVFIAVAAETPNKLLLKAGQEAYEQAIKQAKDLLEKQRKAYEDQCARIADRRTSKMYGEDEKGKRQDARRSNQGAAGVCSGIPIRRTTLH
jgi:hypothetical protein